MSSRILAAAFIRAIFFTKCRRHILGKPSTTCRGCKDDTRGIRMTWTALPIASAGRFSLLGPPALFARIDNCGAKVLFETATGRFF